MAKFTAGSYSMSVECNGTKVLKDAEGNVRKDAEGKDVTQPCTASHNLTMGKDFCKECNNQFVIEVLSIGEQAERQKVIQKKSGEINLLKNNLKKSKEKCDEFELALKTVKVKHSGDLKDKNLEIEALNDVIDDLRKKLKSKGAKSAAKTG